MSHPGGDGKTSSIAKGRTILLYADRRRGQGNPTERRERLFVMPEIAHPIAQIVDGNKENIGRRGRGRLRWQHLRGERAESEQGSFHEHWETMGNTSRARKLRLKARAMRIRASENPACPALVDPNTVLFTPRSELVASLIRAKDFQ